MIKGRAASLIKGHNPSFKASNGWLDKFMLRYGLSMRIKISVSQKLPAQLEKRIESFFIRVRALRAKHQYPLDLIINMDETPLIFDIVPQQTISKKGVKQVPTRSSGAEKRRLTVTLSCTGDGDMLPTFAIFKGKRKLKFISLKEVKVALQKKAAYEDSAFLDLAHANNVDVIIIPGGCTSKIQTLDVSLNKPFKAVVREKWNEYVHSVVDASANPTPQHKLKTADKSKIVCWLKDRLVYLQEDKTVVKKSLFCGITNDLLGSKNHFIRCAKELAELQLPYFQEDDDNPFLDNTSDEEESNEEVEESEDEDDDGDDEVMQQ
ncbi:PREDICTED: uncharacterized protein LOC105312277 [Amphimedon queenslandica]|uniref:HTH CENPB-type domain-containing protein n=1 Tax=Amphimedon queenslandica TaxID=400682 RepID=A0A1X7V643_AMPQE|nr:PREDICTED: uncharacterized protein LOC105312277 [Amphimedon queenslandica]|eukprot:XP_011403093.1 PREDICTED: uncharacterized protein LOC105312277 [Amphimedon queenslandica]